jgi:hypothetical protein
MIVVVNAVLDNIRGAWLVTAAPETRSITGEFGKVLLFVEGRLHLMQIAQSENVREA